MVKLLELIQNLGVGKYVVKIWHKHQLKAETLKKLPELELKINLLIEGEIVGLHPTLDKLCSLIINKGYATENEFKRLNEIYDVYHNLGGNGSGTKLYMQAAALPIKANAEKSER